MIWWLSASFEEFSANLKQLHKHRTGMKHGRSLKVVAFVCILYVVCTGLPSQAYASHHNRGLRLTSHKAFRFRHRQSTGTCEPIVVSLCKDIGYNLTDVSLSPGNITHQEEAMPYVSMSLNKKLRVSSRKLYDFRQTRCWDKTLFQKSQAIQQMLNSTWIKSAYDEITKRQKMLSTTKWKPQILHMKITQYMRIFTPPSGRFSKK